MAEMKHTPATSDGWLAHSCGHRVTVLQRHDVRRARVGGGTGVRTRLDTVTTTAAREKCGGAIPPVSRVGLGGRPTLVSPVARRGDGDAHYSELDLSWCH